MSEDAQVVTLWRFCLEPECAPARWRSSVRIPHPAEYSMETETCEFVPLSALRLVEEELRLERDLRRRAERSRENANAVSLRVEGENRRLSEELRQAREVAANMKAHYEEALASREMELSRLRWSTCAVADELDRVKLGAKVGDDSTAKAYAQRDDAVRRADAAEAAHNQKEKAKWTTTI